MEKAELKIEELEKTEKGQYILPLKKPFQWGEKKITQLELDEPKAKHLRKMPSSPTMGDMMSVIALLAHETDSFIDELSMGDMTRAAEFFGSFE